MKRGKGLYEQVDYDSLLRAAPHTTGAFLGTAIGSGVGDTDWMKFGNVTVSSTGTDNFSNSYTLTGALNMK